MLLIQLESVTRPYRSSGFNLLIRHKIVAAKLRRPSTAKPQRFRLGGGRTKGLRFRHGILPIIERLNSPDDEGHFLTSSGEQDFQEGKEWCHGTREGGSGRSSSRDRKRNPPSRSCRGAFDLHGRN